MEVQFTHEIPAGFDTLLFLECEFHSDPQSSFWVSRPDGPVSLLIPNDQFVVVDTFGANWAVMMPRKTVIEYDLLHCI